MFKDTTLQPGYPHDLITLGNGIPPHGIDSAIWWEDVGKTYFFKGDRSVCRWHTVDTHISSKLMIGKITVPTQ